VLIHRLAEDAQKLTELRGILRGQVHTARKFAVEHCHRYNENKGLKDMLATIDNFLGDVDCRISQLDQIVRDILQFVCILAIPPNALLNLTLCRSLPGFRLVRLTDQRASQQVCGALVGLL
jgi:hypothetical protein